MCGIVGYVGKNQAAKLLINGLVTLEYRGYDSAGVALLVNGELQEIKSVGRVPQLERLVEEVTDPCNTGIGHTRWATHGGVTKANSHPHLSQDRSFAVVHNGIIENHQELRLFLQKHGYNFVSQTDSEVIPHLIEYQYKKLGDTKKAFEATLALLKGAYAIVMTSTKESEVIYAARLSSPLTVGVGEKEHYLTSDPSALPKDFPKLLFLDDFEYIRCDKDGYKITNFKDNKSVIKTPEARDIQAFTRDKDGFDSYLLKEIHETPDTVRSATAGRLRLEERTIKLGGLEIVKEQLKFIDRIVIVACGTSYYAGLVGEYLIEEIADIPVEVQLASEFKYKKEPFSRSTAVLAISQSGETADTIAALKKVEQYGVLRLGIVNAPGSTIARMTDAGVYCHAGPEYSVASTKAFVAQVTVLSLLALKLSESRTPLFMPMLEELSQLDKKIEEILKNKNAIKKMAKKYAGYSSMLFIGRRYGFPVALEGALKLKELSYIHAEGYAAGELKHGPLALIDKDLPVVAIVPKDDLFEKTLSSIEEVKARKGKVIAITDTKSAAVADLANDILYVPKTIPQLQPVLSAVALHLLAHYVALEKAVDIDRPRNLAKSVTVE
jgi:glucosamine--fructose-6-phosphate aminotransferase (isomerizing)